MTVPGVLGAVATVGHHGGVGTIRERAGRAWRSRTPATSGLNRFAAVHGASSVADAFVNVSLAGSLFFNISADASRQQVLLYLLVNLVPFTFLAPLIGPAIDRFPGGHRVIAAALLVVRALLVVGMALTLYDLAFYFFTLALLIAGKASGVTKQALVPSLVDHPDDLVAANSRLARLGVVCGSAAALAAAGVLAVLSAHATLAVGCVAFLLAAGFATRLPQHAVLAEGDELADDALYLQLHTPMVAATAWAFTMIRAAVGFFVLGVAFALRRASEPAYVYGAVAAAYAVGTFAGNVVAPALRRRASEDRLTSGSLMALAVVAGFGALGPSRVLIAVVAGVLGLAASIGRQGFDALVQSRTPLTARGKAFARFETRFQLGWVAGAVLATAIGVPARFGLAVIALGTLPAALFYVRSIHEARRVGVDVPLGAVGMARRRIERLASEDLDEHAREGAIELASVVDLARVADRPVPPAVAARVATLRELALTGGMPGTADLDAAVDAVRAAVATWDDHGPGAGPVPGRAARVLSPQAAAPPTSP